MNRKPRSLLKISSLPWRRKASSRQKIQYTASMLLLIGQPSIRRKYQSMIVFPMTVNSLNHCLDDGIHYGTDDLIGKIKLRRRGSHKL